jgi:hypothetical protein
VNFPDLGHRTIITPLEPSRWHGHGTVQLFGPCGWDIPEVVPTTGDVRWKEAFGKIRGGADNHMVR